MAISVGITNPEAQREAQREAWKADIVAYFNLNYSSSYEIYREVSFREKANQCTSRRKTGRITTSHTSNVGNQSCIWCQTSSKHRDRVLKFSCGNEKRKETLTSHGTEYKSKSQNEANTGVRRIGFHFRFQQPAVFLHRDLEKDLNRVLSILPGTKWNERGLQTDSRCLEKGSGRVAFEISIEALVTDVKNAQCQQQVQTGQKNVF